jgi:hypothetical protein
LGAHNNYGRGCAGCHSPHKGNLGAGGSASGATTDIYTGINALFAQDMGPLYGKTFDFSDVSNSGSANKYLFVAPATGNPTIMTPQQYSDMRGILMCLACHDGVVAKGAMMTNQAYEQRMGYLPTTYGNTPIPTLLGEGTNYGLSTSGSYNNDHPVGEAANLSAVLGAYYNSSANGITFTTAVKNGTTSVNGVTFAGQYQTFVNNYGAPALASGGHSFPTPVNATGQPYLVCTTCHNQHVMNIFAASANNKIAGSATGTYATYFFVNGPYNVNDVATHPASANSTTQFCRQCHFGESNEANGGNLPTTF